MKVYEREFECPLPPASLGLRGGLSGKSGPVAVPEGRRESSPALSVLGATARPSPVPEGRLKGAQHSPDSPLSHFAREVEVRTGEDETPIRFAVTSTTPESCQCEVGFLAGTAKAPPHAASPLFDFKRRAFENTGAFNVVLLAPTGIGCEIGGHAGDAGPVARLLATVCDRLILHPNVVNGSDLNELPENALYVEGSVICRLLQGTVGLQPVRSNRVLVVIDGRRERYITETVINSVNAARSSYGFCCPKVVVLDPPVRLKAGYTSSGRAGGCVDGLEHLMAVLDRERGSFDAVALSGVIDLPFHLYMAYLRGMSDVVNPIGGVEAIYTHALTSLTGVPSAHAPMYVASEIDGSAPPDLLPSHPGIVDPRIAAEVISMAFLQSVLKGLQRGPRILTDPSLWHLPSVLTAADLSCLVIPQGVLGLPVLAALEQGIPVIAVRENQNKMRNDLSLLPWTAGQYTMVENYPEAVGVLAALKGGLSLESVRRPLKPAPVDR
jgi:hypothetical protein